MGEITKEALIAAPAEKVFDYVADVHNAPTFISSITRIVSGPQGKPEQGQTWQAEANFLGRRSAITLKLAHLRPNRLVRFALEGDPKGTMSLQLTPSGKGTHVALLLDVEGVPSFLLQGLMGPLLTGDSVRLKGILE